MRISVKQAATAIGMLVEGTSIRATERITGLHRDTIDKLILVVGRNCQRLLDAKVKGVAAKDVEADEIWAFVGLKEKNRIKQGYTADYGDAWTFIAIERNTKLVLAHTVGDRDMR
jgi:hypothetical protein